MRKAVLAVVLGLAMLITVMPATSGQIQFGHTWGTADHDYAYAVEVDSSGNLFLSGDIQGPPDHVFVAKVNIYGAKLWDIALTSPAKNLYLIDSALGPAGSLYVAGYYADGIANDWGAFYAKIDTNGAIIYQKYLPDLDIVNKICAYAGGNGFVIVGDRTYYGTGAVVAIKDDGSVNWATGISSPDGESPWAVATDSSGAVYTFIDSSGDSNVAIAKLSKTGRLVRQCMLPTDLPYYEYTWDLAVGVDGNIYALGANYGMGQLLLASFTPKLDLRWDEYIGTPTGSYEASRLVVKSDGSLCAVGYTYYNGREGPVIFDISSSGVLLGATYYSLDIFYGTFSMFDACAYPGGGVILAGESLGYPKATPMSIVGMEVMDIPTNWVADNSDWSKLTMSAVTGDIVPVDIDGAMDNYDTGQGLQAWYGITDPPPPAFKSTITVKASPDPYTFTFRAGITGGKSPYTYVWYFDDGSKDYGQRVNHEYAMGGLYDVLLVVTDAKGAVSWSRAVVSLSASPIITYVTHYPDPVYAGDPVTFELSAYDPDGGSLSYLWIFGDGTTVTSLEPYMVHFYSTPGVYDCWITVTDDEGDSTSVIPTVNVIPLPNIIPAADFSFSPLYPLAGTPVRFDASSSVDPDGWIVSYSWTFGDTNTSASGLLVYHTFYVPGVYWVELKVTDNMGGFSFRQKNLMVLPSTPSTEVFRESFDSWDSLDDNWTTWNSTNPLYNYVTIENGTLMMSEYGTQLVDDSLQAMALWKSYVHYTDTLTVSFSLYLPLNHDEKYGYYGQSVYFSLLSQDQAQNLSAVPGINTRFLMDTWTGAPNGWSFANANGSLQKICDFEAGWHSVSVTMKKGSLYWEATFDGVVYGGLTYSSPGKTGYDLGAVRIDNGLREEVVVSRIDNLVVTKSGAPVPPPVASFSAQTVGSTVWVDATTSSSAVGIATYSWDWGDGSPKETYTNPYASHTYSASNVTSSAVTQFPARDAVARGPPTVPYSVFGYVTLGGTDSTPVVGISVLVANVRTGDMLNTTTDVWGYYMVDLSSMPNLYLDGDVIQVTAADGLVHGPDFGVVNVSAPFILVNIVVWPNGQVVYYTITLTITDMLGQTDTETMQVGVRIQ